MPFLSFSFILNCVLILVYVTAACAKTLTQDDCEVCFGVMDKFLATLSKEDKEDHKKVEAAFRKFCKKTENRENRFCYYVGGLDTSATGILTELSKPITSGFPVYKICEKLQNKDAQVCDLHYEKKIDLRTENLKKLKVKDLKNVLNRWNEVCEGCIEKTDFINRIEELKPKHVKDEL